MTISRSSDSLLSFPDDFPFALQEAAKAIYFFWLEKGADEHALIEKILNPAQRAWVIEQRNIWVMGRPLDDDPLTVMVHDGASNLISTELLADEDKEVRTRRQKMDDVS